jgi:hypothetical protein
MKANTAIWISVLILWLPMSAMAAGDVSVELTKKGDLKIKGTNEGNQIMVGNDTFGNVLVAAMPGTSTTVNGGTQLIFTETDFNTIPGKLDAKLGHGDNFLEIDDVNIQDDLKIKTGDGDDTIGIFDATLFDDVSIKLGDGDNLVAASRISIVDKLDLKSSSGIDGIGIADCVATGGKTKIKTGDGADLILLQGSESDALKLDTGKGPDDLFVTRFSNFEGANLKLGSEDDRIVVSSTGVFSGKVKLNGAKGTDTQTLAPATIFPAKTKNIEVFEVEAAADVLPDTAASNLSDAYVARGGDAADIPCP